MTSARRRKRRARTITLPGGETPPQKPMQGQRESKEPADVVALQARKRQGMTAEQARHEMAGCAVGRKLLLDHISDSAELWEAAKHMNRVVLAHDRSIGAPSRHAQCARFLAPSDDMHADASSPAPDLRDPEERARQAKAAYDTLEGWMSHADDAAQRAARRAAVDMPDEPIWDWSGVVLALRCVADGVKGRKVKVRARTP